MPLASRVITEYKVERRALPHGPWEPVSNSSALSVSVAVFEAQPKRDINDMEYEYRITQIMEVQTTVAWR